MSQNNGQDLLPKLTKEQVRKTLDDAVQNSTVLINYVGRLFNDDRARDLLQAITHFEDGQFRLNKYFYEKFGNEIAEEEAPRIIKPDMQ